jgi:LuxR family maltose regulon positive regulatory protein
MSLPDIIIFILDDYHLIDAQPIHDALTFLIQHLPPQMHLVITTRVDPPLPLARLRARGQLNELRAADLRFSHAEATKFLNQVMGLNLSSEDITTLDTRIEGWIAGLQLAALSMHGQDNASSHIESFSGSHRYVLDYLVEEVLKQQPESIQTFLHKTSILDHLTGSLCDAVTGQDNGHTTLQALDRENLFIIPLDAERHWYRYHRLFAELLRQRLRQTQPQLIQTLHIRASEWCESNGFTDEAIRYALRSENYQRAIFLIESVAEDMWGRVDHLKLRDWLAALPTDLVFNRPQLCIFHAGYLFASGDQIATEQYLQAAENKISQHSARAAEPSPIKYNQISETERMKLLGRIAATRSFMASYRSDSLGVIPHAHQALDYLPVQDTTWRGGAAIALGDAYIYQGLYVKAYHTYLEALETIKETGNAYLIMNVSLKLALNLRARGMLQEVIEICEQRMQFASRHGMAKTEMTGWLLAILGETLAEVNDLNGALQRVKQGIELTERGRDAAMLTWSYLCLTRVLFSRGDKAGAEHIISTTMSIAAKTTIPQWVTYLMAAWRVRVWLAQDRLDDALQWINKEKLDPDTESTYVDALKYIAFARILIAQGQYEGATKLLQRLLEQAKAGGHTTRSVGLLNLLALAAQAKGDKDLATDSLKTAFNLAQPGGYIRIFVDEGPPMARLLYEALNRGIAPDYVSRLLTAFLPVEPEQSKRSKSRISASALIEPLSKRELEVLQLIADGLTNQEIAARLYLSTNTVKVHTRNIYGKLGVRSRTQAVARAKRVGILSSN